MSNLDPEIQAYRDEVASEQREVIMPVRKRPLRGD